MLGAVALALVLGALGFQYLIHLAPCEMCHWQRWAHIAAAIIGAIMALLLRHRDVPPRKRYSWEDEAEIAVEEDGDEAPSDPEIGPPRYLIH